MVAAWSGEADSVTGTVPKIRQVELTGRKLMGIVAATYELVADAPMLGSHITKQFGCELALKFGDAVFNGTGSGLPLGIMNSTAKIAVPKESGQAATTAVKANIDRMVSRLPPDSRQRAIWLINPDIESQLNSLNGSVGTGGQLVYRERGDSADAPFATLMGLPVIAAEFCAALGTEGDIALTDWSEYLIVNAGLQVAVSAHVSFETDETHFRFVMRVAGAPAWTSPIAPYRGTLTKSPYVTLATR